MAWRLLALLGAALVLTLCAGYAAAQGPCGGPYWLTPIRPPLPAPIVYERRFQPSGLDLRLDLEVRDRERPFGQRVRIEVRERRQAVFPAYGEPCAPSRGVPDGYYAPPRSAPPSHGGGYRPAVPNGAGRSGGL